MANNLTNATIDVRADTRGLERDIKKALKSVEFSQIDTKKSSQSLGRITGQVSEFNKSLEASNARVIAFGASAGAIFAVQKAFSSLISSTIEVEKKLADINVLLGLTSGGLEKFSKGLFDVARNTGQSFSEVADAAAELARQGLGVEETLKRTNAALILTRLSGLDAKKSVESLTATLNSFSSSALGAVEVVNKLANVDAAFAVSSADLANAISRVGSTAQDAGVSLDELIALVTSAQQTTARGGSVIGNSFKTIFTRLQRGKVKDLLSNLGIDVSDGQNAIGLLQQLASVYDTLGSSQRSAVAEAVGGVFQINVLKAALGDLGKEYSIYGRALQYSVGATDEAIKRNELLNKTVSALSAQTVANLQQAADKIGSIVFEPNAKGFLSSFNDVLEAFNNIDAESAGGKLMEGFFAGVRDYISGPGAVLAIGVLVKLFSRLGTFVSGSAKEILGLNQAAQQRLGIEQAVLSILQSNSKFTNQILTGKLSAVDAEKQMLNYLTAQSTLMKEHERLSKSIAANMIRAGASVGKSGGISVGKKGGLASGFVPNFSSMALAQAAEDVGASQHGYKAGKAKKTRIHDGTGKSFSSVVNSREDIINFRNADGKKATMVRPPNGFGENTQFASSGFVPSFAAVKEIAKRNARVRERLSFSQSSKGDGRLQDDDLINLSGRSYQQKQFGIKTGESFKNYEQRVLRSSQGLLGKKYTSGELLRFASSAAVDGYNVQRSGSNTLIDLLEVKGGKNWNPTSVLNKFLRALPENYLSNNPLDVFRKGRDNIEVGATLVTPFTKGKANPTQKRLLGRGRSAGFVPNFAKMSDLFKRIKANEGVTDPFGKNKNKKGDIRNLGSLPYTMIHGGAGGLKTGQFASFFDKKRDRNYEGKINVAGLDSSSIRNRGLQTRVGDALVTETNDLVKIFNPSAPGFNDPRQLANAGSVASAAGTVFESAVRNAFQGEVSKPESQTSRIDFMSPSPNLRKFFYNAPGSYEAKIGDSGPNRASALSKWIAVNGLAGGFMPKGIVFSKGKKDEFGFETISAKKEGKNVGSIEYFEGGGGKMETGSFDVNKQMRGMGIGRALYQEMIKRNAGKTITGQLLPQTNRFLEKLKRGEKVSAETLYPQMFRADLGKNSVFEVYGHKGMDIETMSKQQFADFVNKKIKELQSDPKKFKRFFGDVDSYDGLGVKLDTQHSSGFVPNFLPPGSQRQIDSKAFYSRAAQPWLAGKKMPYNFDPAKGVNFPGFDFNKRGRVINAEGPPGENVYSIQEFKKIFEENKFRKRFWERRSFEFLPSAAGFVPNFSGALSDAISREKAAGLSANQIYVDQHDSLKNAGNPTGLMVANKRDEPGGGIQGIRRSRKMGINPQSHGAAYSGFVPNFAVGGAEQGISEASKSASKLSKSFDFLKNNALSVGFGLQAIAGMAEQLAGDSLGQTGKAVVGGLGDVASFASTGAMFGVWGAAIGAGVGIIVGLNNGIKEARSKVPEMTKALEESTNSLGRFGESGQRLLELNEKYSTALASGDPNSAKLIADTQKAYAAELANLTDSQRAAMVSAVAQGDAQEAYAKILAEMQETVASQQTSLALQKYKEDGNKKDIAGIESSLASGLTEGVDIKSLQKAIDLSSHALNNHATTAEIQAATLITSIKTLPNLPDDVRKRIQTLGKQFEDAALSTDLESVAEELIRKILDKPKAAEDLEKITEQLKKANEENAAAARKEAEIRSATNARLLSLQAQTEKVTRNFSYTLENLISSMEAASEMRSQAREAGLNFYKEGGLVGTEVNKAEERNLVQGSSDKLMTESYKLTSDAFQSFNQSLTDLVSKIEVGSTGDGQSISVAQNTALEIRNSLQSALLPITQKILAADYGGASSQLDDILKNLTPEQTSALGKEEIEKLKGGLQKGFEGGNRALEVLKANSQKDLALQSQQLAFQRAMAKLAQAQAVGGTAEGLFGENRAAKDTLTSVRRLGLSGYSSKKVETNEYGDVKVGGKDPTKVQAGVLFDFYKNLSSFTGGGVNLQSGSDDFKLLVQVAKEQLKANLEQLKTAGEGVVDPSIFARLNAQIATLGGQDTISQLKIIKELGVEGVTGKNILDESLKQFSSGAFANLDPSLESAFSKTQDSGVAVSLLLLADQQKQTGTLMGGLQALGALGQATGNQTLSVLAQQPALVAQALGAVLKASSAESKLADAQIELDKKALPAKKLGEKISEQKVEAGKLSGKKASKEASLEVQLEEIMGKSGAVAQKLKSASLIKEDGGIDYAKLKEVLSSAAPTGPGSSVLGGSNPVGDTVNKQITATWEDLKGQLAEIKKIESERAATSENVSNLEKKRKGLEPGLSEAQEKVKTLTTKRDEASKAAEVAQQKAAPVYDTGNMESALQAFKVYNEQQRKKAEAAAIVTTPSEQQKQAFARSNLAGKTSRDYELDRTGGTLASYENKAVGADRSGANSIKVFNDLLSQNVVPSMQSFGEIYEGMSKDTSAKEEYDKLGKGMLGPLFEKLTSIQQTPGKMPEAIKPAQEQQSETQSQDQIMNLEKANSSSLTNLDESVGGIARAVADIAKNAIAGGGQASSGGEAGAATTLNVEVPVSININVEGGGEQLAQGIADQIKSQIEAMRPQIESYAKNAIGIKTPPKQLA
jgi:TP901 family phage tail tape measure protein